MYKIKLPEVEKEILSSHRRTSPIQLIKDKAHCMLMHDRGLRTADIAYLLDKKERTIRGWLADYSKQRLASIFSGHENNENASKLTREQKKEIKRVLNSPPNKYNLPREFWDVPSLKSYIKAEFGVVYESYQSYYYLMKYSNLSFKLPDKFDIRRDEKLIAKRMKEIRTEIKPMLGDIGWEVFAADETRVVLESLTRKAWLKKGKKTVIKVNRKREYQNYLGFLNQKSNRCKVYEILWQKQDEILKVFKDFLELYPKKKICVIRDNARFHKGKKIREALGKGNLLERVHLINLPPYAPDKNPIEHIWKWIKDSLSNKRFQSFVKTRKQFIKLSQSRFFNYSI